MMNNREIGLFFDRKYIFDLLTIAQALSSKLLSLGEVIILPIDESKNNPIIIFDKNPDLSICISLTNVMIKISEVNYGLIKEVITTVLNVFKNAKVIFSRVGVVNTLELSGKEKSLFANNAFEASEIINSKEFELYYYQVIDMSGIKLNCWKRYITNKDKFFVIADINTMVEESLVIDLKSVLNFIDFTIDYMEKTQIVKLY